MKQNEQLLRHTFNIYSREQILSLLMSYMGAIVDGIVISRFLGDDAMAAFELVAPLTLIGSMLGLIFSTGLLAACSKCLGSGKVKEAESYFTVTIMAMIPVALIWALSVWLFAKPFVALLGASGESAYLAGEAAGYLRGLAPSLFLTIFIPMQNNIMFLEGKAKFCIISMVCQLSLNIAGDFFNAFYLHWGLFGMGLSTSLSNAVGFGVMLFGKWAVKGGIGFSKIGLGFSKLITVLNTGVSSALDDFYLSIQTWLVNNVLLMVASGASVAAFGIINTLNNLFLPFVLGVTVTGMTMASLSYGERDKGAMSRIFGLTLKRSVLFGFLITAVVMVIAPLLVLPFKSSGDPSFGTTVHALRIFVWMFPLYGFNKMLQDFYLGSNNIKLTFVFSLLESLVFITLSVMVLGRFFGEEGVWWGFVVGEVLAAMVTLLLITVKRKQVPRTADDFLFLPAIYDGLQNTAQIWPATSLDDMKKVSREAKDFMMELGADASKAELMSQFIEELGDLITLWADDEGRQPLINIRLVGIPVCAEDGSPKMDKMGDWVIRVRDNLKPFNLEKWQAVHSDAEQRHVAIRTVVKDAKESSYTYTMGMNYLFVTI